MMETQEGAGAGPSAEEAMSAVLRITESMAGTADTDEQVRDVLQILKDVMKADAAVLLLREDGTLRIYESIGVEEDAKPGFTIQYGQGFAGTIVEKKEHLYVRDAQTDPIVISPYVKRAGIHSMLGVPLLFNGDAIGVLHVDWLKTHLFTERELEIMIAAAEHCASSVAIAKMCERNCDANRQIEMYLDIIEHDIDGLNNIMVNDLETLLSIPDLDRDAKDTVKGIMDDVKESETIVENVRKLHETLSEELLLGTLDLDELIKGAIAEEEMQVGRNINIKYTPQMGRAVNGTEMLKDVFSSILDYMVKSSRGDLTIDINVDKVNMADQPYYVVSIGSNGPGIPDEVKSEFFAFHLGITQARGKALPMFIIRLLTDRIRGDVEVEDRVPGDHTKGPKFTVTIPAIEGEVIAMQEPQYRGTKRIP